jgi:murein peptide amidase A
VALVAVAIAGAACGVVDRRGAPGEETTRGRERPSPPRLSSVRQAEQLGESSQGRPLWAVELGVPKAEHKVLVVGCIHGTECAGTSITRNLLTGPPPKRSSLWVAPNLNPDGRALGTRLNGRGVDLNRNFPSEWRPIGRPGDPEYAGLRPLSEPESRAAARLIRTVRPDVTVWFHQPQHLVRAWGPSVRTARRYAELAGVRFRALPWLSGTAPNWQNHRFRSSTAFVVELPPGSLPRRSARRHADAIRSFAP